MPNQYLFQLAEQPPADMAALLGIFKSSVPALVRRRAKELLEVIREAVRRGLEGKQVAKVEEEANKTGSEVVAQDVASKEKMEVDSTPPQASSSHLFWGKGKFFSIMRTGCLSTYFHNGRSTFNIIDICSLGSQVLPVWLHDIYISWIRCFFIHNDNKRLVWQYARKARFWGEQSTFSTAFVYLMIT